MRLILEMLRYVNFFLMDNKVYRVDTIAADSLVMQGARSSAAMLLTWFAQNIPVSAPEGLALMTHYF